MPLGIGETFAGYKTLRLLGSGGMGEVYLVQHPRLPRQDALKVLRPDLSSDPSFRERFIREADLAAGLRHPHIVGIHDRGEYDGQLWIAMDFIDGTDTAHLLERKYPAGMPVDLVLPIINAVASALDYAHKRGLLHRDVKPANIIVTDLEGDEPSVFLADFGVARPLDDTSGITTTNMTVGTVAYAAPEQLMGETMDGRADQYALAATSYNLLTGSQLFPNSNPAVVISRHLNAPVPALGNVSPQLSPLDPVLTAGLAKDPNRRFASCADFACAFAEIVHPNGRISALAPTTPAAIPSPTSTNTVAPAGLTSVKKRRRIRTKPALLVIALAATVTAVLAIATQADSPQTQRSQPGSNTPTASAVPPPVTSRSSPQAVQTTTLAQTSQPDAKYALPECYGKKRSRNIAPEPTGTKPSCRFHWYDGLSWTAWTNTRADGNGFEHLSNCNPGCAQGEIFENPVELHFSDPEPPPPDSECPTDLRYYSQLIVAYPSTPLPAEDAVTSSQNSRDKPVATRYNGMPAYRWNGLTPFCMSLGPLDQ